MRIQRRELRANVAQFFRALHCLGREKLETEGALAHRAFSSEENAHEKALYSSAPPKAHQKLSTSKPRRIEPTAQNNKALSTSTKRPSVRIVTGKVRITRMGRSSVLTSPSTSTAINASGHHLTICTPGRIWVTSHSATAF